MLLRAATIEDLATLRRWDAKAHVIAATGADDAYPWADELPRNVAWRELLIGEHEGRPVGAMQIIDPRIEETHYWGDIAPNLRAVDIWIGDEADLGRGFGTEMMHLAIERPSLGCSSTRSPPTRARTASTSASASNASSADISATTIASSIALHAPTGRRLGNLV